jgi:phage shock protein PspC (stress-responsive transcriptional regulator)
MQQTQTLPFERPRTGRVLTGATTAIANRTGIGRHWIRAGFVVSSLLAGLGVVAYAFATIAIRSEGQALTPFQQWITRFDSSESTGQKLGWWILTTLMLAAIATVSFLQGPFVVLALLVLGGWLASRPTVRLETA